MISQNQELQTRLKNLQSDIDNGNTGWFANNLKAIDLILLLKFDPKIRNIIREIMQEDPDDLRDLPIQNKKDNTGTANFPASQKEQYNIKSQEMLKTEVIKVKEDPLRQGLSEPLTLIAKIKSDPEFSGFWLDGIQGESEELMTILIKLGNFEEITRLHDWLKDRCKKRQSAITNDEKYILETALKLHNKAYKSRNAQLNYVEPNIKYDFKNHERANTNGETVKACWLPGLKNAAGILLEKNKPLVETN